MEELKVKEIQIDMKRVKNEARDILLHVERFNNKETKQLDKAYQGLALLLAGLSSLYAYGAYRNYVEDFVKSLINSLYGILH